MKVAIVHDWLTGMGGAEKVVIELHKIFPNAPIYTSVVNYKKIDPIFKEMDIRTTFIQKLPFSKKKYNRYLPLFPIAFESLDLSEYDLILSSTTSIGAKGVLRNSSSIHICYCNTPPRYTWDFYHEYLASAGRMQRIAIPILMHYLRTYDQLSSSRVDYYIANSTNVKERISKIYNKSSTVIHPPVDVEYYQPETVTDDTNDYYIIVSRLVSYKRVDLAIEACNKLNKNLIVIGHGEEFEKLKQLSGPTITLLGYQTDEQIKTYMQKSKAFLFPGFEDFGIAPVEAQACGKPVIAYGKGGALDTVLHEKTGVLFNDHTVDALCEAIQKFETMKFSSQEIRQHAENFSQKNFSQKILGFIESSMEINRTML